MLQRNILPALKLLSFSSALTICFQANKVQSWTPESTKEVAEHLKRHKLFCSPQRGVNVDNARTTIR